MAVLLDGPAWARRRTVGDRDGLPVEVLGEMLRWPAVERVWLPSWLADPAGVVDQLVAVGGHRAGRPVAGADRVPDGGGRVVQGRGGAAVGGDVGGGAGRRRSRSRPPRKPAGPVAMDGETPFVPWIPKTAGEKSVLDELPAAKAARAVRRGADGRASRRRGRSTSTG